MFINIIIIIIIWVKCMISLFFYKWLNGLAMLWIYNKDLTSPHDILDELSKKKKKNTIRFRNLNL